MYKIDIFRIWQQLRASDLVDVSNHFVEEDGTIAIKTNKTAVLDGCIFAGIVTFEIEGVHTQKLNLDGATFKKHLHINVDQSGQCIISAKKAVFEDGFTIVTKQGTSLDCSGAHWAGTIRLETSSFSSLAFDELKYLGDGSNNMIQADKTVFTRSSFKSAQLGEAFFRNSRFEEAVNFEFTLFNSAHFNFSHFKGILYLSSSAVHDSWNFNNCIFSNSVYAFLFHGQTNNSKIIFSGSRFSGRTYLEGYKVATVNCQDVTFEEYVSFNAAQFDEIDLTDTTFVKNADFSHTRFIKASLESIRKIQSELIKGENKVDLMYYKSQELNKYIEHLKGRRHFFERTMLLLNKWSSNHGTDWGRGVWFTFRVSIFFYTAYIITLSGKGFTWDWKGWDGYWQAVDYVIRNYFNFLAIFRDFTFIDGSTPHSWSYAIDFIGRIFVGYGIYQTIQAFRKYGKS